MRFDYTPLMAPKDPEANNAAGNAEASADASVQPIKDQPITAAPFKPSYGDIYYYHKPSRTNSVLVADNDSELAEYSDGVKRRKPLEDEKFYADFGVPHNNIMDMKDYDQYLMWKSGDRAATANNNNKNSTWYRSGDDVEAGQDQTFRFAGKDENGNDIWYTASRQKQKDGTWGATRYGTIGYGGDHQENEIDEQTYYNALHRNRYNYYPDKFGGRTHNGGDDINAATVVKMGGRENPNHPSVRFGYYDNPDTGAQERYGYNTGNFGWYGNETDGSDYEYFRQKAKDEKAAQNSAKLGRMVDYRNSKKKLN